MTDAREKAESYALDLSGVTWLSPGGTVLRYTAAEWEAFALGVRDGEFDLPSCF